MRAAAYFIFALAAVIPLFAKSEKAAAPVNFPGWPQNFEGRPLVELALTEKEKGFLLDFPGKVARFSDGQKELIIRWVRSESRKLHPAGDCLKGSGHSVSPEPLAVDSDGNYWGCVMAGQGSARMRVCERIYDQAGNSYSDTSAWYWAAILGWTAGPWWAVTVAERQER